MFVYRVIGMILMTFLLRSSIQMMELRAKFYSIWDQAEILPSSCRVQLVHSASSNLRRPVRLIG